MNKGGESERIFSLDDRLTIAQITPSFYPLIGGIELYVLYLSRELVKRGHEVHVYTPDLVMKRRLAPAEAEVDRIKIHRLPVILELSYRAKMWPQIFSRLLKDSDKIDVIHIQGHDHFYSLMAAVAGKMKNVRVAVTTYGPSLAQTEYSLKKRPFFEAYDRLVTPLVFHWADKVLAKFPFVNDWIRSYGVPQKKMGLAPSGIPDECLKLLNGDRFRRKYGIKGPLVLYMGRISPQKGVQYLVKAMPRVLEEVPDALLLLVGPDYSNFKAKLMEMSHKLRVEKNVTFVDPIHNLKEEMQIYAACDVFIMPSSFEGFSQAVHKAWAQKKPVIVTNVGFLRVHVENGKDGLLVDYGDCVALAKAIVKILQYPKLARTYGAYGRKKVHQYTFNVLATNLEKIYYELLARKLGD